MITESYRVDIYTGTKWIKWMKNGTELEAICCFQILMGNKNCRGAKIVKSISHTYCYNNKDYQFIR